METTHPSGLVMMASSVGLRARLLGLPGVADVQVEGPEEEPNAVRVRLARDADQRAVQESVQRVLSEQGLRSRLAPPRVRLQPVAPPPPPGGAEDDDLGFRGPPAPPDAGARGTAPRRTAARPRPGALEVEEIEDRVRVRLSDDAGRRVVREASRSLRGLEQAVVECAAALAAPNDPPPTVLSVTDVHQEGLAVVTVVLDTAQGPRAGSAVVRADRTLALARAVWSALSET